MAKEMGDQFGFLADVDGHLAAAEVAYAGGSADVCAAHAAMAAAGLVQRLAARVRGLSSEEPSWERNDVVRGRLRYQLAPGAEVLLSVYYLLQRKEEDSRWWHAVVLKADEGTGAQVGVATRIPEGDLRYHVARFPD